MKAIIRRVLKNYLKNPFFWIGLFFIVFQMYQILSPYLHIHYYQQGEAAEELAISGMRTSRTGMCPRTKGSVWSLPANW